MGSYDSVTGSMTNLSLASVERRGTRQFRRSVTKHDFGQEREETIEYGDVIPGARTVIYVAAIYKSNKLSLCSS